MRLSSSRILVMKHGFIAEHASVLGLGICSKQQGPLLLVKLLPAAAMTLCQTCLSCTVLLLCLTPSHTSAGKGRCRSTRRKRNKSKSLVKEGQRLRVLWLGLFEVLRDVIPWPELCLWHPPVTAELHCNGRKFECWVHNSCSQEA